MTSSISNDEAIMATNDDAASCKRFAIQLGYWKDPFLEHFIKSSERKAPEINRGYFARVVGIKLLVDQFYEKTGPNCQIVNLGAGFDTLFWRLKDEGISLKSFVELDFPAVTSRKIHYIKSRKILLETLVQDAEEEEVQYSTSEMHCGSYHLVGVDLRVVSDLSSKLLPFVDASLPTLFLAECLLVYLDTSHSRSLLRWIPSNFSSPLFINYEQVNIDDTFGHVMVDNLRKRSCTLFGTSSCKSIETQKNRFLAEGWDEAKVWDMNKVYNAIPRIEVERIERIEFLDETELLHQLLQHYCIVVAYKGDTLDLQLCTIGFT